MELKIVEQLDAYPPIARRITPTEIVIHHSWTPTVDAMIRALNKKSCRTHYAVDRDGVVYKLLADNKKGAHCVGHNDKAIGIDVIRGPGQQILDVQYEALRMLVKVLAQKYDIPLKLHKEGLFLHRDLRATECPGEFDERCLMF